MSEFRLWLQAHIARLDGDRERRIIALGAMALFLVLLAGPRTLHAVGTAAHAAAQLPRKLTAPAAPLPASATDTAKTASPSEVPASGGTSVTRFAEIISVRLATPSGNSVAASGVQSDFPPASAAFHAESGAAFSQDFPAARGADGTWRADFNLPPGGSYAVTLVVVSGDGLLVKSPGTRIDVPAAPSPMSPTAPTVAPSLVILFPDAEASSAAPVAMSARILDATAVGVIFEIKDSAGNLISLPAAYAPAEDAWDAAFTGAAGAYAFTVRASLENGFVQQFTEQRAFTVLADTVDATATPTVDLLSPTEEDAPFDGSVPLYASAKDGPPDRVVFVVDADSGGETIVLAKQAPDDGVWTGSFEGEPGGYGVRARATFGGVDVFSGRRHFALKTAMP